MLVYNKGRATPKLQAAWLLMRLRGIVCTDEFCLVLTTSGIFGLAESEATIAPHPLHSADLLDRLLEPGGH